MGSVRIVTWSNCQWHLCYCLSAFDDCGSFLSASPGTPCMLYRTQASMQKEVTFVQVVLGEAVCIRFATNSMSIALILSTMLDAFIFCPHDLASGGFYLCVGSCSE